MTYQTVKSLIKNIIVLYDIDAQQNVGKNEGFKTRRKFQGRK